MRSLRTLGAAAGVVVIMAVGALPAAAQPPTYTWHRQTLWKQSVTTDPATGKNVTTCYRLPAVVKTSNDVLLAFAERRNRNDCASVRLVYSDDHGASWRIGATATYDKFVLKLGEQTLVERTDGGILVFARNGVVPDQTSVHGLARATSSDGGESFDGDFRADDAVTAPPTHPALLRQRWNGGPYTRILLSAPATPKTGNNPVGMNVRSSFDEGTTWRHHDGAAGNAGIRIDADHAGYSDMTLAGNGAIGVLYEAGSARFRDEIRWNWFWESAIGLP
ncbi:hypothetical protein ACGFJC_43610 [Nonomuraea fuscirosea]|uniref:hypothetical protein n=1 Tax=Nonomuraea fuscirosea TaxID=1291556 RepID=UPI003484251E